MPAGSQVIYFIRHAHAEHNAAMERGFVEYARAHDKSEPNFARDQWAFVRARIMRAPVDADLTPRGARQLEALRPRAVAMVAAGVALVVSSSMRRTLRTATEPFAGLPLPPVLALDELREQAMTFPSERRRPLDQVRETPSALAQNLGQLQPFIAVSPPGCISQPAPIGPASHPPRSRSAPTSRAPTCAHAARRTTASCAAARRATPSTGRAGSSPRTGGRPARRRDGGVLIS
jgi:hypothetical protein